VWKRTEGVRDKQEAWKLLEKGIDNKSHCAIAQADIAKYYDSLPLFKLSTWLLLKGVPACLVAACLRHQAFTSLHVALSGASSSPTIRNRHIGGLTGSRIAGSLGRIPVEEMVLILEPTWTDRAFLNQVSIGTWVDNIFAFSNSVGGAISMLEDCERYLLTNWGLTLKANSLEFMPAWRYGPVEEVEERWKQVSSFRALGHILQPSGSIDGCFATTIASAWRAFWGNIGKAIFRNFQISVKLKRLQSIVFPVISFRLSRWPFTLSKAKALDRVQRKMVGIMLGVRLHPPETFEAFARRKNKLISATINKKWSVAWASQLISWKQHVDRNTAKCCRAARIAHFRTPAELSELRSLNNGRPLVRAEAGFTSMRWFESVEHASNYLSSMS